MPTEILTTYSPAAASCLLSAKRFCYGHIMVYDYRLLLVLVQLPNCYHFFDGGIFTVRGLLLHIVSIFN